MSARPYGETPFACPDCSALSVDGHLTHIDTCPLGRTSDEQMADDRDWFNAHPEAGRRRRRPYWAELAELRMLGLLPTDGEVHGHVVVIRGPGDGLRYRRFDQLRWQGRP